MSIALTAKVEALERRVIALEAEKRTALMAVDMLAQRFNLFEERVATLTDIVAQRSPKAAALKGKDNG